MQSPVITFVSLYRGQALYCRPSLGVAYVQAFLRTNHLESQQYVSRVPISFDALIDEVILTGSDVVGMACYENNFPCVAMLATALKKRKKDLVLVVGGPSATFADEAILKDCPSVDFCIRGEGEYTTFEFLNALRRDRHLDSVLGLSYRRSGRVVRAPDRPLVANLDDLPSPYLTGVVPAAEGGIVNSLGIVTARGCPFKCIYCNFSIMGRQRVRFHSVDRVVQELRFLHSALRTGAVLKEPVPIYDDTFTVNADRTRAICSALAREGVNGLEFDIQTRADSVDAELLGVLRQIGVTRLNFGLESGVPRVLNLIQKVRSGQRGETDDFAAEKRYIARVQDMAAAARDRGIRVSVSIIQGLPGERVEDVAQTHKIARAIRPAEVVQNRCNAHHGTDLCNNADRYGLRLRKPRRGSLHNAVLNPSEALDYPPVFQPPASAEQRCPVPFRIFTAALPPAGLSGVHHVVLVGTPRLGSRLIAWMRRETVATAISVWAPRASPDDAERNLAALLRHGFTMFPIQYFIPKTARTTRTPALANGEVWFDSLIEEVLPVHREVRFHSMSTFSQLAAAAPQERVQQPVIAMLSIDNAADISALRALAERMEQGGDLVIPPAAVASYLSLSDECRWLCQRCPAASLTKVFVDRRGVVRPCAKGRPIGSIAMTVDQLRARIAGAQRQLEEERKCNDCVARDRCSRCMFPYPVDWREYCALRRSHPGLEAVALGLVVPRSLPWRALGSTVGATDSLACLGDDPTSTPLAALRILSPGRRQRDSLPLARAALSDSALDALMASAQRMITRRRGLVTFQFGVTTHLGVQRPREDTRSGSMLLYKTGTQTAAIARMVQIARDADDLVERLTNAFPPQPEGVEGLLKVLDRLHTIFVSG